MDSAATGTFADTAAAPRYGVDAPGVVRGLLGGGAACLVAAVVLVGVLPGAWTLLGWVLLIPAVALLALGTSMLLYAWAGKHRLRDHLLRQWRWRGDEVVLDIGSGRGLLAIAAAHRAPAGKVYALDIWSARDLSGNTPASLRRNAALEGVAERLEVLEADARAMPLPDASVDVVVSLFCLHNIEPAAERAAACAEIARVLRPGGMAMLADFPGTADYVPVLRRLGLSVSGPLRAERIAGGIAGYLVARK